MPNHSRISAEKAKRIAEEYAPTTDELLDRCYKDIVARAKRGAVKCRLFLPKQMVSEAKWKAVKKSLSDNGYDLEPVARPPKDKWGLRVSWS